MGTSINEKQELRGESLYSIIHPVIRPMARNNSRYSKDLSMLSDWKVNTAFAPLQNILKKVEEKSERETTALDAHKELETVSVNELPLKAIKIKQVCPVSPQKRPTNCIRSLLELFLQIPVLCFKSNFFFKVFLALKDEPMQQLFIVSQGKNPLLTTDTYVSSLGRDNAFPWGFQEYKVFLQMPEGDGSY